MSREYFWLLDDWSNKFQSEEINLVLSDGCLSCRYSPFPGFSPDDGMVAQRRYTASSVPLYSF